MLYVTGIIITFFLAAILWSKKGKTVADNVLAVWLCVIGLHLFFYYWYITGQAYHYPHLLGVQIPLPLLHGPLLYIYTSTVTREEGFKKKYLLHFIPAAVAYLALIEFYRLPAAEKVRVFRNEGEGFELYNSILIAAILVSGFLYVFLSFRELWLYRKRIAEEFSNTERINLNWLRGLIWGILCIWIIVAAADDPWVFGATVIFVLLLGYFGIKHVGIFTYQRQIEATVHASSKPKLALEEIEPASGEGENEEPLIIQGQKLKYERSSLQKQAADKIYVDLNRLMESGRVFKNAELSLAQLARELETHPNNLSQVINTYENKSFYDYINNLRIQEFKTIVALPENRNYTLLSLAFECGFNSKTSFNRNFKKITGQSPSEFLKEMDVELVSE